MAGALHGKYASAGGLRYLGHPEAVPNPDKKLAFPMHGELITRNGIFSHENLVFDELIRDRRYQFVYYFSPMTIKGATGSAGGPIAVV